MSDRLKVTLTLKATSTDGSPFSKATSTSYSMTPDAFHAIEEGLANLLVGFGDQAVTKRNPPPDNHYTGVGPKDPRRAEHAG